MSTSRNKNNKGFPHITSLPVIKVDCAEDEEIPMVEIKHDNLTPSPYARREREYQQRFRNGRWSPISISSDEDYQDEMDDVVGRNLHGEIFLIKYYKNFHFILMNYFFK